LKIKQHIFDSEKFTFRTDQRILVSLRDALDDLIMLYKEQEKLDECQRHLFRAAYSAWQDAAVIQIIKLDRRLSSWGAGGSIDEAYRLLNVAREQVAQARANFSNNPENAIELMKAATLSATDGLSKVTEAPRISRISVMLTLLGATLTVIGIIVTILNFLK
jgi:hypothetical protein